MEILGGSRLAIDSTMMRKRSSISRRPRADSNALFQSFFGWLSHAEPSGKHAENENVRGTVVASDGIGTDNKLKKLKLKFGGVTHTIHAKPKTETGFSCGSSITNFSPCSGGPKPQKKRGRGENLLKLSGTESGLTAGNRSHRRKATGQNINVNNEHAHKNKRITTRCALDAGFSDEDNEDAELCFLGKFSASKRAVSRHKVNRGGTGTAMHVISNVAERSDIKDLEDLGTRGSIKDGKKKFNSEKKYEGQDYYVEEDPRSSDELISEVKKPKRESDDLLVQRKHCALINRNCSVDSFKDVLSGADARIIDSSGKKGKLSEEQQIKKAEAAKKRKIQSEKAAREAEEAAIRKILGQDSARKRKEEKMNKRRDEFTQEKSIKSLNLGSNTVRWTMGPKGTIVTFSEDIGLPSIFQTITNSYPPPREKCAGPNCSNAYKYRDSNSKLPLCSLGCYRAIHEKIPSVVAC